jgi:hypothetical protein
VHLQVIEALHRKQNSVKNLTSNIRNDEARMAKVLDDEFHRGVCADVVPKSEEIRAKMQKVASTECLPIAPPQNTNATMIEC